MAATQLGLYNDALLLLGQRQLSGLTEEREPRRRLDDIWGIEALEFCLEVSKPLFARETNTLSSPTTSSEHGLDSVHSLPSDYLSMVAVYSDDKLDQPLNRFIIENRTVACEFSTIYVRFVSSTLATTYASWTPSFTKVVAAYLARELAERISPLKYADMDATFQERVQVVLGEAAAKEPTKRPTATGFTLTADYLNIYNDALILMGLDELATINDDSDRRTKLDRVMNNGAVDYCLEVLSPVFARKVALLNTPTTSAIHDLDSVHTLPSDYVDIVEVYSDSKLDQPISRAIFDATTLSCEFDTVYLRYVSNTVATSSWTPSFKRVLSAYLAREAWLSLNPDSYENYGTLDDALQGRIEAVASLEAKKEPQKRASGSTSTLSAPWLIIYNDALLIMGLDEIIDANDDSDRRAKLDRALNAGLVESVLEDTSWTFGLTSVKSQYDPSIEPEFGYIRGHGHPPDMQVLDGIYQDEYMQVPLKHYKDEGEVFFCDLNDVYIQYVDTEFLANPANWPAYFRRLIAGRLAKDAAGSITGADKENSNEEYSERKESAMSTDAMLAPPRRLTRGNWTSARYRGGYRNRPGGW